MTNGAKAGPPRFRPLPAGSHGLDPREVRSDQARRLREAMIELIAAKGYPAVRIADLAKLAHVSPPTLYSLYADKEQLLLGAYEHAARMIGEAILAAHVEHEGQAERLRAALAAFAELAAREPRAMSLLMLGAFGAGPAVLRKRRAALDALEAYIHSNRAPGLPIDEGDLTVHALLGGIREITAARLRHGRQHELPALAAALAAWTDCYPVPLPAGLAVSPTQDRPRERGGRARPPAGKLPSGPSGLPPEAIARSQQERIVEATVAIVAEQGLAALTIPAIVKRASVSNKAFYALYPSKHDAFLGAQKVGMHQALRVAAEAYDAHPDDWPRAIAAGIGALLGYLASEPEHAHLAIVDTFAASPQTIAIRQDTIDAFRTYLAPGFKRAGLPPELPGELAAEAVVGGIWNVLYDHVERDATAALPAVAPQLSYFTLAPFIGAQAAAAVALKA